MASQNMIRNIRKESGLSMADLSRRSSVDYSSLCRFELGCSRPSRETAERLAQALGVKVADLFPGETLRALGGK